MNSIRAAIARRAAQDLPDGACVNLGIGIPTLVPAFVSDEKEIVYQSENGLVGMGRPPLPGEEDEDLINASKDYTTLIPGASICDSSQAFAIMRGGHVDVALMGAFEVAANGDLANWSRAEPGMPPGVGGAMDLAVGARQVWVLMNHAGKDGRARILEECILPVTAFSVVTRIYTERAVMDVVGGEIVVREMAAGQSRQELQDATGARLTFVD